MARIFVWSILTVVRGAGVNSTDSLLFQALSPDFREHKGNPVYYIKWVLKLSHDCWHSLKINYRKKLACISMDSQRNFAVDNVFIQENKPYILQLDTP